MSSPGGHTSKEPETKKKLQLLTQEEVSILLQNLGLDKHIETFRRFHVDGVVLSSFKAETDLSGELQMKSHVQRLNLISHIKDFLDVQKGVPLALLEPPIESRSRHRALSSLNVTEVGQLMTRLELPNIAGIAEEHRLDGSMLAEVTDSDLKSELKIESRMQRAKVIKKVTDFKTYGVPIEFLGEHDDDDDCRGEGKTDYDDDGEGDFSRK